MSEHEVRANQMRNALLAAPRRSLIGEREAS
jgi:hypothetical protein